MRLYWWFIFTIVAITSFVPLVRIDVFKVSDKYKYFKYISLALFAWTGIISVRNLTGNPYILYYAALTVYPLLFFLSSLVFISMMQYLGKKIPWIVTVVLLLFFLADLAISYTNNIHLLMKDLPFDKSLTNAIITQAPHGMLFYVHTAACYLILMISVISVLVKLYKNLKKEKDVFPFVVMALSIVLGILANVLYLLSIIDIPIDPTYIVLVVLVSLMYLIFYIRDVKLMLKFNGNEYIINNLSEMYMLVNHRGKIVSASKELLIKFGIDIEEGLAFSEFKNRIADMAFLYKESMSNDNEYIEDKLYIHMTEKNIRLPLFNHSGKFYLFFDETQNQKYIHDYNYVMTHDLMTRIYNRNYFESLESEIEKNYQNYSLIMFDLDGLKLYNDYLGHSAGDELLIRFADALKEICTKYDNLIPIRMGGDEFLLIAIDKDMNDIEGIIYELKIITASKDLLKHIGFSYGYAQNHFANKPFVRVMAAADEGLYLMKTERRKDKEILENFLKKL